MKKARAIGLDIGTTTICALVLDGAAGEILQTITMPNNAAVLGKYSWEKLQDASILTLQIEKIIQELTLQYAPISCIGITGQMHGIVYISEQGDAVSPLFSWQDERGNQEYQEGLSYAKYLSELTGCKLAAGFGAVTHFYNTVNDLIPASAASFCTIMDYVAMKLSNTEKPLIHSSNAASIGLFDMETNQFNTEAIRKTHMGECFFPNVSKGIRQVGITSSNIPIAVAIGDNQASFIGSVRSNTECLLVNIGTSSQISVYTDYCSDYSQVETRPLVEDGFLLVGSPLCGGRAYALLEGFFRDIVEKVAGKESPKLYNLMEVLAASFSELENPLEITTQFCGTRENPSLRGTVSNIGIDNFTPKHFTVGVLQGMASELYALYEGMKPQLSKEPTLLIGSGNGVRMNKSLQQILSKLFNMPLHIPVYKEEASYGAALFALVSIGFFKNMQEAQQLIRYE